VTTISRRVAIVEDDANTLSALSELIGRWGYEPVAFATFEAARAYLLTDRPHALLVDVRLGAYNGLQLVHLAQQHYAGLNVIAMSGYDDSVLRREAEQAGAGFILKPLNIDRLREKLA